MANYLQNRLPTKGADVTPYEGWFGWKPNIKHFQRFGAKCYVLIPDEKRRKLDKKATQMVLVGYDDKSKAYRCYDPLSRKVTISRDVKFAVEDSDSLFVPQSSDAQNEPIPHDSDADDNEHCNTSPGQPTNQPNPSIGTDSGETVLRRSERPSVPPQRYCDEFCIASVVQEPKTYNEAVTGPCKDYWWRAMQEEMDSLRNNNTWELCDLPRDRKAIGSK